MITKDSKMQKWLDDNPSVLANQYLLAEKQESDRWVNGINGDKRLLKDVVRDTHTAVSEIKEDTQILRDFAGFHNFMLKYKGYWLLGLLLGLLAASMGIKTHLL